MRAKSAGNRKVNVVTLGCSKNIYDSEVLMAQLKGNDFEVTHESPNLKSEIVIINTCGFIENAKKESIDTILAFAEAKQKGKLEKLYVTGCLSERYKSELEIEIPEVDAYFGTKELPHLLKTLKANYKHELIGERLLTTPRHYAYLKISEGCDRPCSFCAIPLMRGAHASTPIDELIKQAQTLAAGGVKELILIAQDLTYYGLDLYKKRKLPELLEKLSDVNGIDWIRLHYAFPTGFPMEVLDVMRSSEKVCNYLDIPLQHINNRILESMKRGTTAEKTTALIRSIREQVPGIALRTTLISGYPGETEKEHREMADWVAEMKFDRLGVFPYSHEENTTAFKLSDTVTVEEKTERVQEIMEIQQGISLELNQKKVGNTYKVLFDRKEGNYFIGRTEFDSPDVDNEVLVDARERYVRIGDFSNVTVTKAEDFDLFGELS